MSFNHKIVYDIMIFNLDLTPIGVFHRKLKKNPFLIYQSDMADRARSISTASEKGGIDSFSKFYDSPYYNILLLALAWAATLTSSTLLTTVGPLSAKSLGGDDSTATFTIGSFLLGAALSSVPSGPMFRNLGRKWGFLCGCIFQCIGSAIGMLSIDNNDVTLLLVGCCFVGLGQGIGQFYRFSATEMTPDRLKARAVTYVLTGGVLAAFLGPASASYSSNMFEKEYQGSFLVMGMIAVCNAIIVCLVRFDKKAPGDSNSRSARNSRSSRNSRNSKSNELAANNNTADLMRGIVTRRSLWEIVSQPLFVISCMIPTAAHTMMVMLMSSVTLAMIKDGFTFQDSSLVMVMHFLAMFGPGFFTGNLIGKYGALAVSIVGGVLFGCSCVTMWVGDSMYNYAIGMILCGVGWNFCFSSGTVMLMGSYKPEEATDVQAFNDFILFSIAAGGSLLSGWLFSSKGWIVLIYVVTGLVGLYMILFAVSWKIKANLEERQGASTIYEQINPAVIEKSLAREFEDEDEGESSEEEDGIVQGVEWWQPDPSVFLRNTKSFDVHGRKGNGSTEQQEMMVRSASVI